ncbi:MAG TPA: SAM-dependent methyltransferase [Frankiaceae bacterium]|nr:SAM-dependent methyltransferase [Frankiaceae bacterium]
MATRRTNKPVSPVVLLGAGPGPRDLLTVRGAELLAAADVVLADPDIPAALFDTLRAEVVPVGGAGGEDAASLCLARARAGERVVRAYAGDPWLHPAGVAEARALAKAKVPFEVVPGLPATAVVPTYAGIPVGVPHTAATADAVADWATLAHSPGTLVLSARSGDVGKIGTALVEHGLPADTPMAVTVRGTTIDQRTVVTTLDAAEAEAAGPGRLRLGSVERGDDRALVDGRATDGDRHRGVGR